MHLVGFIIRNLFQFSRIINIVLVRSSTTSTSLPSGRRKIFLFRFLSSHPFSLTSGTSSCETEVLTAVLMKVRVFWDITPCRLINSRLLVLGLLDPEDAGSSILRNIGNYLPVNIWMFLFFFLVQITKMVLGCSHIVHCLKVYEPADCKFLHLIFHWIYL